MEPITITVRDFNLAIALTVYIVCLYGYAQILLGIRIDTETRSVLLNSLFFLLLYNSINLAAKLLDGRQGTFIHAVLVIANFGKYMAVIILIYAITRLMSLQINAERGSDLVTHIILVCITGQVLLLVINLFTGIIYTISPDNIYMRAGGYVIAYVLPTISFLTLFGFRVTEGHRLRRKEILVFDFCFTFTLLAEAVQFIIRGVSLTVLAACIGTMLLYMLIVGDQRERYEEQLRKNAAMSARIMAGQLEPHFISNTLVMIRALCEPGSDAYKAISNLSEFVGGSLRALKAIEPIPIEDELQIVEHYLDIQNQRFENSIEVLWDIQDEDFSIPAFSIQLAAENAIKHGIRMRPDGRGTLYVSTYETETSHVARIENDGAGFDPASVKEGTGLSSLKLRVRDMCKGSVDITSAPDSNIVVTIYIPKNRKDKVS